MPIPPRQLKTPRLLFRASSAAEADRAYEIQKDWEVTRMLSLARYPPDRQEVEQWFADHQRQWEVGQAYRFAVVLDGRMLGLVDIDGVSAREATLGYWLDRAVWGHGYAFEAARAAVEFAFEELGLLKLKAGHAQDNTASGCILNKLGFNRLEPIKLYSRSRGEYISQCCYQKMSDRIDV
ncbi:ribosomal-protein-alanine N-acetyltransferase [Bradyrhizobium sp. USDA 4369]